MADPEVPAQATQSSLPRAPGETENGSYKGNILVVDDTPANLHLLFGMLAKQGYRVRVATNGPDAIESVHASSPDLILLDVMMPGMDGFEVCRRLKAEAQTCDIPIIFLSALDQTEDKVQAFTSGGVDYITKPFQIGEVMARVGTHVALQQATKHLQEKTSQLEQANQELAREIAERKLEILARIEAEEALRQAQIELEARVHERTAELSASNVALHAEIAERQRAEAQRERSTRRLIASSHMGRTVLSSLDLQTVLNQVVDEVSALLPTHEISILLREEEELVFAAVSGPAAQALQGQRMPVYAGVAGEVMRSGQAMYVSGVEANARSYLQINQLADYYPGAILAVPLKSGAQVFGLMEAVHPQANAFSEDDLRMLEGASNWVAIAIANARQHAELGRRLRETQAMAEINLALSETLDLDRILVRIVNAAQEIIPKAEEAVIHLLKEQNQVLQAVAVAGPTSPGQNKLQMHPGEGIAGLVLTEGHAITVGDVQNDPRYLTPGAPSHLHSLLVAPVQIGERPLGTISVQSAAPHAFSAEDERLLVRLGIQAALAIENAQLFAETERRAHEFAALYETTRDLATQRDVSTLLATILNRTTELLKTPGSTIRLYDAKRDELELVVAKQVPLPIGTRTPAQGGLAGHVVQTRQPIIIDDYNTWAGKRSPDERLPYSAVVQVPMLDRGELIGVLGVHELLPSTRKFTETDVRLLTLLAGQAASAVHNARLLEEAVKRADQLALLYDAGLALNSVLELHTQLGTLSRLAMKTLGASHTAFFRYHPTTQELQFEFGIDADENVIAMRQTLQYLTDAEHERDPLGWVVQHHLPLLVNDVSADPRWSQLLHSVIRSGLWVPVERENHLLGILMVSSPEANAFTADHERLLTLFANQAAVALENARLYTELQNALQHEQTMRAQLVLADKLAALGRMVATVAHELNNPLQSIQNCLYILAQPEGSRASKERFLKVALSEIGRASGMIEELRSVYRTRSEQAVQSGTVGDILTELSTLTAPHFKKKRVYYKAVVTPSKLRLKRIPVQFKQVFLNLCLNAVDAMQPDGGTLMLRVSLSESQNELGFAFKDTGRGIQSEDLAHIFEPFFTTKETGMGLGLAICYDIVTGYGGRITVESQPGTGATFTVWLPFDSAEALN